MDQELKIENLSKKYSGNILALDNFNLKIKTGILGLLGPNGAGKSTLMRIIASISKPTEGTVIWNGEDIVKKPNLIRKSLGYLPQSFGVYPNLNAIEFLKYMAALKGINKNVAKTRIDELLMNLNLFEDRKRPLGGYSGGMKQRIGIAQALLNDPKILIVDEPTVGLDPQERVRFRNLIADISGDRIVILSTHIVSDVEASATNIAIMNNGILIKSDEPENLMQSINGKVWKFTIHSNEFIKAREKYLISGTIRTKEGIQIRVVNDAKPHPSAEMLNPNLEDAYLFYTSNHYQGI